MKSRPLLIVFLSTAMTTWVAGATTIDVVAFPCDSRTANQAQSKGYQKGDEFEVCVKPAAKYESDYVIVGFESVTCRNKGESKTIVSRGKRVDKDTTIIDDVKSNENVMAFKTLASPGFFKRGDSSLRCTGEVILESVEAPESMSIEAEVKPDESCRRRLRAKFKNDSSESSGDSSRPENSEKSSFATKIRLLPKSSKENEESQTEQAEDDVEIDVVAYPCDSRTGIRVESKGYEKGDDFDVCVAPTAEYESDYVIVGFDSVSCRNRGESKTLVSQSRRVDKNTTIIEYVDGNENIMAFKTVASPGFFKRGDSSLRCTGAVVLATLRAEMDIGEQRDFFLNRRKQPSCRHLRAKFRNDPLVGSGGSSDLRNSFATKIRLLPESTQAPSSETSIKISEAPTELVEDDVEIDVVAYPCDSRTGNQAQSKGYRMGDNFEVCVKPASTYESDYAIVRFDSVTCRNKGESKTIVSRGKKVDKDTTIIDDVEGNENIVAFKTVASPEFFNSGDLSLGCTGEVILVSVETTYPKGQRLSCRRRLRAKFKNDSSEDSESISDPGSLKKSSFATKIRLLPESTPAPSAQTSIQTSEAPTELVEDAIEIDIVAYPCDSRMGTQTQSEGYRIGDNFEVCVAPTAEYESDYVIVGFDSVSCRNRGESKTIISHGFKIDDNTTIIDDVESNANIMAFKTVASPGFFSRGESILDCSGKVVLVPFRESENIADRREVFLNKDKRPSCRHLREKFRNASLDGSGESRKPGTSSFATKIRLLSEPTLAPSTQITIQPTEAPTGLAEDRPEQRPCAKDVKLTRTDGVTAFGGIADAAVSIVSQDRSTVTVALKQTWNTPYIEKYFYHYKEDTFSSQCYESIDVETGAIIDTITIKCNVIAPIALLNICLQDNTGSFLDSGDNGEVGKCCHSDAPEGTPTVCYNLAINCQTECEEGDERIRHLRSRSA